MADLSALFKAMGAIERGLAEEELQPLVNAWRQSNPKIVRFWWDVDKAVKKAVKERSLQEICGVKISCRSGMLFITLPSGRTLAYVKPRIGENKFGRESVTYEGVGGTKKWERIESYGPKFVENIVQATARDILMYAMKTLRCYSIVAHVHDELIIEGDSQMSLEAVCEQMGRVPPWAKELVLRADGYVCDFYKIGIISGEKPSYTPQNVRDFISYVRRLVPDEKIYWKESIIKYAKEIQT